MTYPPGPPGSTGPVGPMPHPSAPPPGAPWSTGPVPASPPPAGPPPPAGAPSAPPAAPPPAPRRRLRILGRAVLVLVVIGALAGTTAWGFTNRSSAEKWRDRSEAADAHLTASLERVEETSAALEDARTRLRALAADNADETDRNRLLSEIVRQAPEVTEVMRDCQEQTTDLANDIIAAYGDPAADIPALQDRADDVNRTCDDALEAATALEESIDALGL